MRNSLGYSILITHFLSKVYIATMTIANRIFIIFLIFINSQEVVMGFFDFWAATRMNPQVQCLIKANARLKA